MGQNRKPQQRSTYNRTRYIDDGSSARQLMPAPDREYDVRRERVRREYEQERIRREQEQSRRVKQKPEKAAKPISVSRGIDFITMVFLSAVVLVTVFACFRYLDLQSELKQMDKTIVTREGELKNLVDKNNAAEKEFDKAVDFDAIYQVAVGELGMIFPNNNEIISYERSVNEYVRRYDVVEEIKLSTLLDKLFQK